MTRHCTPVHRLWVQKCEKLEKRVCFWSYRQILERHDEQIKKNACKNAYLGSIFIPEKYVIRVLFVSPWTSLIPPLAIRVAPQGYEKTELSFNIKITEVWKKVATRQFWKKKICMSFIGISKPFRLKGRVPQDPIFKDVMHFLKH